MSTDANDLIDGRNGTTSEGSSGTGFSDAELLELPGLGSLIAARTVPAPSGELVASALAVVRAAAERESTTEPAPTRRVTLLRRLRRQWVPAAVLVAAVATGASLLPVVDFGGGGPAASANAATTFLNGVANQVAQQKVQEAPYWKYTLRAFDTRGMRPANQIRTTYVGRDSSVLVGGSSPNVVIPEVRGQQHTWPVGDGRITWDQLKTLPTDPTRLAARLNPSGRESGVVIGIENLLVTAPVSPNVRAALFRVLAGLPGVRLDGTAKDRLGRTGTQVDFIVPEQRSRGLRVLIDPRTGSILQYEQTVDGRLASGAVTQFSGPANKVG